jgi:RNA recognition motif-containing protein
VRNISYDTTKEDLEEYFEKFGKVEDIKLVKQHDGEGH